MEFWLRLSRDRRLVTVTSPRKTIKGRIMAMMMPGFMERITMEY